MSPIPRTLLLALSIAVPLSAQDRAPKIPTTRRPAGPDTELEIHTRDLGELSAHLSELRHGEPNPAQSERDRAELRTEIAHSMASTVRAFIEPGLGLGEDVQLVSGRFLVAVCRVEQHNWIDRFLTRQPGLIDKMADLEIRVFSIDARSRAKLGIGERASVLDARDGRELIAALDKKAAGPGVEAVSAPRISALPMQKVKISVVRQISYVRDFEITVAAERMTADPVVGVLQDGLVFAGEFAQIGEGKIGLRGSLHLAEALLPFPTKDFELVPGTPKVTIQIPSVREVDIETEAALPNGSYAVFPGPLFQGRYPVVIVRAAVLPR